MPLPVLLVHGSFHTGECWESLTPILADRGINSNAVTLSGHRGHPKCPWSVSMATYGSDVIAAAEAFDRPCVLVGHSMGGMVISEAAERRPDLFASMIYLSAFVPRFGKSSLVKAEPVTPALRNGTKTSFLKGVATIPPETARTVFYNRCERAIQDRAIALLCPQPIRAAIATVVTSEARLGSVPKHYIECADDNAFPVASQRVMRAHTQFDSVATLDSDHSPFLCRPIELADVIGRIAGA